MPSPRSAMERSCRGHRSASATSSEPSSSRRSVNNALLMPTTSSRITVAGPGSACAGAGGWQTSLDDLQSPAFCESALDLRNAGFALSKCLADATAPVIPWMTYRTHIQTSRELLCKTSSPKKPLAQLVATRSWVIFCGMMSPIRPDGNGLMRLRLYRVNSVLCQEAGHKVET